MFIVLILVKYKNLITPIIFLIVFIPISFFAFQKLPFLKDKLTDQIETSTSTISYTSHRNRFSSAIIDLADFQEYPLAGRGKYNESRFDKGVKAINRNNGTTDFLVMYGLIGFVLYFAYYVISFKKITRYYNWTNKFTIYYYLLIILVLGFSENYFLLPFFWSLCFIGYPFVCQAIQKKHKIEQSNSIIV